MYILVQCCKTTPPSNIHTKFFAFQFIIFTSCTSTPLYIITHGPSCHPTSQQNKNEFIYLQYFDDIYLALSFLSHLILTRIRWLQPRKGGMHFILSDNGNYDFDVKVKRCRFVGFVKDVIDCGCLGCVFCFRIKEKEGDTFYINFYSTIFLQSCFFISHYLNWIIIMDMCVKFIIVSSYDELITNKIL